MKNNPEPRLLLDAAYQHRRLSEVGLRMTRRMRQRHEHFLMALFARHLSVRIEPMLDRRNEHVQLRPPDR